jgi:hydrogenase maturation factor
MRSSQVWGLTHKVDGGLPIASNGMLIICGDKESAEKALATLAKEQQEMFVVTQLTVVGP